MFIVSPLGETVKGYLKRYGKKSPPIKLNCPCCARRLRRHGHYHRWVASRRRRYRIPIYRQFCPGCGKTFSLLPPFLRPYAQFITALREAAARRYILLERPLGEVAARIAAPQVGEVSQRTLLRWFRHLVATAPGVNTGLARLILELAPGSDLMATGPPGRDRQASVRTMFQLGHTLNQVARSFGQRLFGFVNLHLLRDSYL